MVKAGYTPSFTVAVTVSSSVLGQIIPPSLIMIVYASTAGVSIQALFMAGILPGILFAFSMMVVSYIYAVKYNYPKEKRKTLKEILISFKNALTVLALPFIILGGVLSGVFTATESSAIACVYVFLLSYVVFRNAKLREIGKTLRNALKTLAIVMALIACAKAFSYMMTELRVPAMVTSGLLSITKNRVLLILIINLLLLVLGCFMDMAPLIMIMTPILLPIVTGPVIGMHPIHFGVMLIFNLAVGLCTPPVGSALFVGCAVGKTSIEGTTRKMLPLFFTMVFALLLVTFIPAISMWLPKALFGI
jgi:tripartite ATP-independent transporter DctM subunit